MMNNNIGHFCRGVNFDPQLRKIIRMIMLKFRFGVTNIDYRTAWRIALAKLFDNCLYEWILPSW